MLIKTQTAAMLRQSDLATIEAVREAVGSEMSLMVDFNQGLQLGEALEWCHAIDDLGLAWIEEPIVYDNIEGYARLTADLKTPIQIGKKFYGPRALYTALQMKACDYVMPDFMRIGGVTGWQRAAAISAAAGVPISTHLYPEVAAHVMRVTETAHWLEWQDWANPILHQPYEVKDGKLHIPDAPGVGLEWDEKAVAAHLADNLPRQARDSADFKAPGKLARNPSEMGEKVRERGDHDRAIILPSTCPRVAVTGAGVGGLTPPAFRPCAVPQKRWLRIAL